MNIADLVEINGINCSNCKNRLILIVNSALVVSLRIPQRSRAHNQALIRAPLTDSYTHNKLISTVNQRLHAPFYLLSYFLDHSFAPGRLILEIA